MSNEDGPSLNPLTSEILSALMDCYDSEVKETPNDDDFETLLAQFACGWITDEERTTVISKLTESEELRLRLLEMRETLKSSKQGVLSANDPVLAKAVMMSVKGLMNVYSHWKEACVSVLAAGSARLDEIRSLHTAMRRIDARWSLQPAGAALTRGETRTGTITIQPGNTVAQLHIQTTSNGDATFNAEIRSPWERAKDLSLYVVGPDGEWIFLGSASTDGLQWQLAVTRFGERLGSAVTDLNTSWLALAEGPHLPKRSTLRLDRTTDGVDSSVWLATTTPASVLGGEFSVGIELPDAVRAELVGGMIVASVNLGAVNYVIGRWRVSDLPGSRQVFLRAPLDGVEDGEIEMESAIRFSFTLADLHE